MAKLPHDQVLALLRAAIDCGLVEPLNQVGLLAGLPAGYVATLPADGAPLVRLKVVLHKLNDTPRLLDGTLPMEVWLQNAVEQTEAASHPASAVFRKALALLGGGVAKPGAQLRFLFLGVQAGGSGHAALDPGAAYRAIEHELALAGSKDAVALKSGWAVRLTDVLRYLNDPWRPHVVHFHAHGNDRGRLLLAGDGDRPMPVPPEPLAKLFAGTDLRLVFFSACHSADLARAAVTEVDFAVGMKGTVEEKAATAFAAAFHPLISLGRPVQQAFDKALALMSGMGLGEEDRPLLCSRPGVDPTTAVLLPRA